MSIRKLFLASLIVLLTMPAALSQTYNWQKLTLRGRTDGYFWYGNFAGGNFVTRADGKVLVTYRIGRRAMLSVVDSEDVLFSTSNASAANEAPFYTYYSLSDQPQSILQKLSSGKILLYIVEPGVESSAARPFKIDVYESANGLGTDFAKKSTIYSRTLYGNNFGDRNMGMPIEIGGRILLPAGLPVRVFTLPDVVFEARLYCVISTDGGSTWTFSQIAPDDWRRSHSRGLGVAGDQLMVLDQFWHASGQTTLYTHPLSTLVGTRMFSRDRAAWVRHATYRQRYIGDMVGSHLFYGGDGYTYLLRDDWFMANFGNGYFVFRRPSSAAIDLTGQKPYSIWPFGSSAVWQGPLNARALGDDNNEVLSVTPHGAIAFYGTSHFGGGSVSHLFVGKPNPPAASGSSR